MSTYTTITKLWGKTITSKITEISNRYIIITSNETETNTTYYISKETFNNPPDYETFKEIHNNKIKEILEQDGNTDD